MKKRLEAIFFAAIVAIGVFLVVYLGAQRTAADNAALNQWRYEHAVR